MNAQEKQPINYARPSFIFHSASKSYIPISVIKRMTDVFKGFVASCWILMVCGGALPVVTPASAQTPLMQLAQDSSQYPIQPSEAANIARDSNPGSKVLNVKLLPNGVYAVTLKQGGSVSRVMVDATSGAIS